MSALEEKVSSMATKKKKENTQKKICFLITPIGTAGSEERSRVDQWVKLIYEPALGKEYKIIRADKISSPGIITEQVVQYILDADLALIDYTNVNPNVMYEAAIRHLAEKPFIQIHPSNYSLPFDIHNLRSISYDTTDLSYPSKLVEAIKDGLKEIKVSTYQQPQIVKDKFDFNKILSDPEKFVKLLKTHIIGPTDNKPGENVFVTVGDSYDYMHSASVFGLGRKKLVCPKCKIIQVVDNYDAFGNTALVSYGVGNTKHYRCKNCGAEFEG